MYTSFNVRSFCFLIKAEEALNVANAAAAATATDLKTSQAELQASHGVLKAAQADLKASRAGLKAAQDDLKGALRSKFETGEKLAAEKKNRREAEKKVRTWASLSTHHIFGYIYMGSPKLFRSSCIHLSICLSFFLCSCLAI